MIPTLTPSSTNPASSEPDQARVLLQGISWDTYTAILTDIGERATRLTYDNGVLEIELPGRLHQLIKWLIAEMVIAAMKKLRIEYEPSGATTWRKHAALKGLEADDCYHIQNIAQVLGRSELDLTIDPPPDLAIEVEVAAPLIDKMEVYRSLRVPELWRIRADGTCEIYLLHLEGNYHACTKSMAIPIFTTAMISHYVLLREQQSHGETLRRFESEILAQIQN